MNVLSYFLIVLGGFGIVWGYRCGKYRGRKAPALGEFEYAAFSAVWGSIYLLALFSLRNLAGVPSDESIAMFFAVPFTISPFIFIGGVVIGLAAYDFSKFINKAWLGALIGRW